MTKVKEILEMMRKKVIEIHKFGKGYKAISNAFGLLLEVGAIISKWKKGGKNFQSLFIFEMPPGHNHIGMRLLHSAAADHRVSISRQ